MFSVQQIDAIKHMVMADAMAHNDWQSELKNGKMFGLLIVGCDSADNSILHKLDGESIYALWAYSGQIGGRSDWEGYVPAIYDYLQPNGYFKKEERNISRLNEEIEKLTNGAEFISLREKRDRLETERTRVVNEYREYIAANKATRTVSEAQFQNAELRRRKQTNKDEIQNLTDSLNSINNQILRIKQERRKRSDVLQRWLFTQHRLTAPSGKDDSLLEVFGEYVKRTSSRLTMPPAGIGECCAPRLLCYANSHGLKPLALAEFWIGNSPRGEIRHEGQYYEPCQAKCVPLMSFLCPPRMQIITGSGSTAYGINNQNAGANILVKQVEAMEIVYEDEWIIAINKPSGLLSVPGRYNAKSAEDLLREMRPDLKDLRVVHRLDMDTSGLLLAAKDVDTYIALQQMFASHECVEKEYVALIVSEQLPKVYVGDINLPIAPDFDNRPRQCVDYKKGKKAMSRYEIGKVVETLPIDDNDKTVYRVRLKPSTGRTHQLRIHCAHADGLAMPILGDPLYGNVMAERMYLHAERLTFLHPVSQKKIKLEAPADF